VRLSTRGAIPTSVHCDAWRRVGGGGRAGGVVGAGGRGPSCHFCCGSYLPLACRGVGRRGGDGGREAGALAPAAAAVCDGRHVVYGGVVGVGDVRVESLVPAAAATCGAAIPAVVTLALFSVHGGLVEAAVMFETKIVQPAAGACACGHAARYLRMCIAVRGAVLEAADVRVALLGQAVGAAPATFVAAVFSLSFVAVWAGVAGTADVRRGRWRRRRRPCAQAVTRCAAASWWRCSYWRLRWCWWRLPCEPPRLLCSTTARAPRCAAVLWRRQACRWGRLRRRRRR